MEQAFNELIAAGFKVRPARLDDLPEVVPMFNTAEAELRGAGDYTVERYTREWTENEIDLEASTRLVIAPGGQMVGLVELWDMFNPPVHPWIWGRVHPAWRGQGVGSGMLRWALETSKRVLERLPEDVRMAPTTAVPTHHAPSIALFEGEGMQVRRYSFQMIRGIDGPLPEPKLPEGIRIRTLRYPDDLEEVYRMQDVAFSEHWGYIQAPFEDGFRRWKGYMFEAMKLKPELWFLAVDGERIVGHINAQERSDIVADLAYIPDLAVLKEYRRRGLGEALLYQAFRALQERGVGRVSLGVDSKNRSGATRLYERVGMHVDQEQVSYEKELRPGRELGVQD